MKSFRGAAVVSVAIVAGLGIVLAFAHGGGSVNEAKWVARNEAVLASLRPYPKARLVGSESTGIADRVVHNPSDDGPPYSGYTTAYKYELPKPARGVGIGDFYARQLNGWARKPIGSCEWTFSSSSGAALIVDACHGEDAATGVYVVDVNYDEARSLRDAAEHP